MEGINTSSAVLREKCFGALFLFISQQINELLSYYLNYTTYLKTLLSFIPHFILYEKPD